jgi:hypothetical protein
LTGVTKYCIERVLCIVLHWQALLNTVVGDVDVKESCGCAEPPRKMLSQAVERGIKYLESKGFDIILTQRNLQFDQNEVSDLPAMTLIYNDIVGNKSMVEDFRIPNRRYEKPS